MAPAIIPVIHCATKDQALHEAAVAFETGNEGVMLIHMEGRDHFLGPVARQIKQRWPERLVGINYLTLEPEIAMRENIFHDLDMTWTDKQVTHSVESNERECYALGQALANYPDHLFFAGVAFKHQSHEPDPVGAAKRAIELGMIPTTSGPRTGTPPSAEHVQSLRDAIGANSSLSIASGIDPHNAAMFAPLLSHILVATGVSRSFHEFDPEKLLALRQACGHDTARQEQN